MNKHRRPSLSTAALALAVVALVIAAIGPAAADRGATNAAVTPKKALKVAKKANKRSTEALALAQAAGPVGYAEINGEVPTGGDTVNGARSLNVSDAQVTHPFTGLYCLNLSFTPKNVVASTEQATNGINVLTTVRLSDTVNCPGSETASVTLRNVEANADVDGNVFILFN